MVVLGFVGIATLEASDPWADRIVEDQTFGPFHYSALWNDPNAVLGKVNTLDRDDTDWMNPTFREIHMAWPAWYQGTNDSSLANTPYPGGNPVRNNGTGLVGGQIVVEFDEPIVNNADDGGAYHWGVDFIVHGNPFFVGVEGMNYPDTNMEEYHIKEAGSSTPMATGNIFSEPVTVSVAQYVDGPWYTFVQETDGEGNPIWPIVSADNYFPTQPFAWDSVAHDWTDQELDWTKPVNPNLTGADFGGLLSGGPGATLVASIPGFLLRAVLIVLGGLLAGWVVTFVQCLRVVCYALLRQSIDQSGPSEIFFPPASTRS
jgi:hypothetical protein